MLLSAVLMLLSAGILLADFALVIFTLGMAVLLLAERRCARG